MEDILSVLFSGQYAPSPTCSPRYHELCEELSPLCEQVHQTFGLHFVDRFTLLQSEIAHEQSWQAFRQGVILGIKLMEEVHATDTD